MKQSLLYILICLCMALFCRPVLAFGAGVKQAKPFTVVIDAGHGGRDPGALGSIAREKDINLSIALKLGQRIEKGLPDVRVLYTRKTDIFLPLQERANFVNANSADLFICIHTNAAESTAANGVETFTLGLNKVESNLDVAMRENSVILLEDDYQATYQGFDPASVESYIMFEFMQDQYIDKSISFATLTQNAMHKHCGRHDRGVRQAALWVLHKSACPSVLIEVGFISNRQEEKYLASAAGQNALADAIFGAVCEYKHEIDKKNGIAAIQKGTNTQVSTTQQTTVSTDNVTYKLQIAVGKKELPANDPAFKGLKNISYYKEGDFYKYTYGSENTFSAIDKLRKTIKKQFPDAFVIAFYQGKKINLNEARKLEKQ